MKIRRRHAKHRKLFAIMLAVILTIMNVPIVSRAEEISGTTVKADIVVDLSKAVKSIYNTDGLGTEADDLSDSVLEDIESNGEIIAYHGKVGSLTYLVTVSLANELDMSSLEDMTEQERNISIVENIMALNVVVVNDTKSGKNYVILVDDKGLCESVDYDGATPIDMEEEEEFPEAKGKNAAVGQVQEGTAVEETETAGENVKAEEDNKAEDEKIGGQENETIGEVKAESSENDQSNQGEISNSDQAGEGGSINEATDSNDGNLDKDSSQSGKPSSDNVDSEKSNSNMNDSGSIDSGKSDSGKNDNENTDNENSNSGKTDSGNTDSGKGDSGKSDSGNTDSGKGESGKTDSGNTDSGKGNSGKSDSGNSDSGKGESGKSDSGNSDSGKGDSGKSDSGNSDSGKGDSGKSDSGNTDSGKGDSGNSGSGKSDSDDNKTQLSMSRHETYILTEGTPVSLATLSNAVSVSDEATVNATELAGNIIAAEMGAKQGAKFSFILHTKDYEPEYTAYYNISSSDPGIKVIDDGKKVAYCHNYSKAAPSSKGNRFRRMTYEEASMDETMDIEDLDKDEVINLLYAGYPYDSKGLLSSEETKVSTSDAYHITQSVLWYLCNHSGRPDDTSYGYYMNDIVYGGDVYINPVQKKYRDTLLEAAKGQIDNVRIPVLSIKGDTLFQKNNDVYSTGLLTGYSEYGGSYTISELPEGYYLTDKNGDKIDLGTKLRLQKDSFRICTNEEPSEEEIVFYIDYQYQQSGIYLYEPLEKGKDFEYQDLVRLFLTSETDHVPLKTSFIPGKDPSVDPDPDYTPDPEPETPETDPPIEPETPVPETPETNPPIEPETPVPETPETNPPIEPETPTPEIPETNPPIEPETPVPETPETNPPIEPETPTPEIPETNPPIEPETPVPETPETNPPIEPETPVPETSASVNNPDHSGGSGGGFNRIDTSSSDNGRNQSQTPEAQNTDPETVVILENEVPLAAFTNSPVNEEYVEIDDGNIPLAGLPKTGEHKGMGKIMFMFAGILSGLYLSKRKQKNKM